MADFVILIATTGRNRELAEQVMRVASQRDVTAEICDLSSFDLLLYTPANKNLVPAALADLERTLSPQRPWVVLLPEYNGGLPPLWINALTWLSVQGNDFRALFTRRKIGVGTASGGHGWKALAAMREQFAHLGADVVGRYLRHTRDAAAKDETIADVLDRLGL